MTIRDCPSKCGWVSSDQSKALIEQRLVKTLGSHSQQVAQAHNLATLGLKQENCKFNASLSNLVRPCFKLKVNGC